MASKNSENVENNQPTNRLIHEKSPYLLQHAHNPVDWYSWSDEAFEQARKLDRPVFLSIGYATCHWCHVMAHESFEDPQTASFMNENFIAIKVDREERPDVDSLYMRALQATGVQGGWPMSMFLTPDRNPITGGTYFPPEEKHGLPSFRQVLDTVLNYWNNEREKVEKSSESLLGVLRGMTDKEQKDQVQVMASLALDSFYRGLRNTYDGRYGGFLGNGHNKFPPSMALSLLIRQLQKEHDDELLGMVENTIDHMIRGGIYDQVGGGLARYSTDQQWMIPHFEKMLYDNAQFASLLTDAYALTGNKRYREVAYDIFNYVNERLTSPEGGLYCAEDADSEDGEGAYYAWSYDEIKEELESLFDGETVASIMTFWGVTKAGNFAQKNILHQVEQPEEFTRSHGLDAQSFLEKLQKARAHLKQVRARRPPVGRDEKILVSWNGLMITALSKGARIFHDQGLQDRATKAARFILENMSRSDGSDGHLYRRYYAGDAAVDGLLVDYANLGNALISLYLTDFNIEWIKHTYTMADVIKNDFAADNGGFFDTPSTSSDLPVRPVEAYDGVEPSGNSSATMLFSRLALLGIDPAENTDIVSAAIRRFTPVLQDHSTLLPYMLRALLVRTYGPPEIALIIGENPEKADQFLEWIRLQEDPIIACAHEKDIAEHARYIPLLQDRYAIHGKTTIYHCKNMTCLRPVHSLDQYRDLLSQTGG